MRGRRGRDGGRECEARSPGGRRRAHMRALQPCAEVELARHRRRGRRRVAPAHRPRIIKRNAAPGGCNPAIMHCNGRSDGCGGAGAAAERRTEGGAAAHVAHARSRSAFASCGGRAHAWTHGAARTHGRSAAACMPHRPCATRLCGLHACRTAQRELAHAHAYTGCGRLGPKGVGRIAGRRGRGVPGSCGSGCASAR